MSALVNKRILIVDDEPMIREILRDVLEYEGARVEEAENGKIALECHQKRGFDAVISDIRMPGGDGLELLQHLRRLDFSTPVVMLITGFSDLSHDAAYNLGADAVLSKPFDVHELVARLIFLLTPFQERWSTRAEVETRRHLTECVSGARLGRGGMFVPGFVSSAVGEWVSFSIPAKEMEIELKGMGVVRWVRRVSTAGLIEGSGVEFRYLEPEPLERLLKLIPGRVNPAFIPDRV